MLRPRLELCIGQYLSNAIADKTNYFLALIWMTRAIEKDAEIYVARQVLDLSVHSGNATVFHIASAILVLINPVKAQAKVKAVCSWWYRWWHCCH